MSEKVDIAFLPVWGKMNQTIPVMQMKALREMGVKCSYGRHSVWFPATRTKLATGCKAIHFDWIHAYTLSPGLVASLVKSLLFMLDIWMAHKLLGVKLFWTIHNLKHHDPRPRKLEKWIYTWFAGRCSKVRLLGPGIKDIVSARFRIPHEKIVEIPEGSFIEWYPTTCSSVEQARQKLNIPLHHKVILNFGSLRPYKGIEDLIEAFKKLKVGDMHLLIAGNPYNGQYAEKIKTLAQNVADISIHAYPVPDEEVQCYFMAADLVVLPFKDILNSGSTLLAMGFGKAVVAPSVGLIPFRLKHQTELLFGDGKSLEEALALALSMDTATLQQIGEANKAWAATFTWNDFAAFIKAEL